jgi:hypothetical protein
LSITSGEFRFSNPALHNTGLLVGQGGIESLEQMMFTVGIPVKEKP